MARYVFARSFPPELVSNQPVLENSETVPSFCSNPHEGFFCHRNISRFWAQYTPYFSLAANNKSEIHPAVPEGCSIRFVQGLYRHGARYPTTHKTRLYHELLSQLRQRTTHYGPGYEFLQQLTFPIESNSMSFFGRHQMEHAGMDFHARYSQVNGIGLAAPFVRASGSQRVIESAECFLDGFSKEQDRLFDPSDPDRPLRDKHQIDVIIPERRSQPEGVLNNTLNWKGSCPRFDEEHKQNDNVEQAKFLRRFFAPTQQRINDNLRGSNLTLQQIISLMDLCAFDTLLSLNADTQSDDHRSLSPICHLFTHDEWMNYDYYYTIGKYHEFGQGHYLGPNLGIGFVNELLARLTNQPVQDQTNVNHTLDSNPDTFPLGLPFYADFTHDNNMISIMAAMRLFNLTSGLPSDGVFAPEDAQGYSNAWLVPFGARMYFEKMQCEPQSTDVKFTTADGMVEFVRVLVNDRVIPLKGCPADEFGRCTLADFVEGLHFVRSNGEWDKCHTDK